MRIYAALGNPLPEFFDGYRSVFLLVAADNFVHGPWLEERMIANRWLLLSDRGGERKLSVSRTDSVEPLMTLINTNKNRCGKPLAVRLALTESWTGCCSERESVPKRNSCCLLVVCICMDTAERRADPSNSEMREKGIERNESGPGWGAGVPLN